MKVGNLTFLSIGGCFNIVIGPNPVAGLFIGLFISGFMFWVLINMAWVLTKDWMRYVGYFAISLEMLLFITLSFSNPGLPSQILPQKQANLDESPLLSSTRNKICKKCQEKFQIPNDRIYTVNKVKHCEDCGVCVEEMDHHCGVFDRCIGRNNLCLFYSVLFFFFMTLCFLMISASASGVTGGIGVTTTPVSSG